MSFIDLKHNFSFNQVLQDCFESRDVQKLQDVIASMDKAEASYHMKRCVDSGLWVADASKLNEEEGTENNSEGGQYATVKEEVKEEGK